MAEHVPAYMRVVNDITEKIRTDALKPGDQLPSIAAMAAQYGTSKTTIKSAQAILRAQGLIEGHHGKAVYVARSRKPSTGSGNHGD